MGDMVLLTPLLDVLVERYGSACDLIGSRFSPDLFSDDPRIRQIYTLKSYNRPYLLAPDQRDLVRSLRNRPPGPVFLLDTHPRVYRLLRLAGIKPDRIVRRGKEGRIAGIHVVIDNLNLAGKNEGFPGTLDDHKIRGSRLYVPEKARREISEILSEKQIANDAYIVVQAGTSRSLKRKKLKLKKHWPENRWVVLIQRILAEYPQMNVFLSGASVEYEYVKELAMKCGSSRVHNLTPIMTIPRLKALLEKAVCCISVDTGPAHVAAAVGCPLVVLFGGTYPGRTSPVSCGSPVEIVSGPADAPLSTTEKEWLATHSMLGITPELVMETMSNIVCREQNR